MSKSCSSIWLSGSPPWARTCTKSCSTVTVTSKVGDKTLYLAEVQQAGVFGIAGLPEAQLQSTLWVPIARASCFLRPPVHR